MLCSAVRNTRLGPLLVSLATLVAVGCQPGEHVVLLDLTSQQDVASIEVRVLSLDTTRTTEVRRLTFSPPRTVEEITADPIRIAVRLEGPALVMVHVIARTPDDPVGTLIATRCYGVDGVIEDTAVLVGPIGAVDLDGDTFLANPDTGCREAVPGMGERACDDFDFVCPMDRASDCDDANAMRYPGAPFICRNDIDEDCDGTDEACGDLDRDGFEACSATPTPGCDCNDSDPGVNPGAAEANSDSSVCNDGIDQNCDGVDTCCDLDGDGYEQCPGFEGDCVDFDPTATNDTERTTQCRRAFADPSCDPNQINPGASEEPVAGMNCDGIDNNCNGIADDSDACRGPDLDGDGVANCGREEPGAPCDPNDCDSGIRRGPGSREICGNSIDENGDGTAAACDPADTDGDGEPAPRDCNDMDRFAYNHMSGDPVFDLCADTISATCVPGEERDCSADTDGDGYVEPAGCEGNPARGPLVMEICNGIDDDCDGNIDEVLDESGTTGCVDGMMLDFQTDRTHCGVCRNFCTEVGNQDDVCVTGMCDCPSEPGVGQCGGAMPACCTDGCRDLVDDRFNCGACGAVCGLGEACQGGVCTCGAGIVAPGVGQQACPDPGDESSVCCGSACRDVTSDNANCGDCNFRCGANSSCQSRFCQCDAPAGGNEFRDCNTDRLSNPANNGCETNVRTDVSNCGSCSNACSLPQASAVCTGGACAIASCIGNFDDCNMTAFDGCEGSLRSLTHCGSCGSGCSIANATATCASGGCRVQSCNSLWADCNSDGTSCETRLTQMNQCGGCGVTCDADETCNSAGRCACAGTTGGVGTGPVCGGATPYCAASGCVRCVVDGNCSGATPQCVSNVCRLCDVSDNAGCGGATPQCLGGTSCVRCITDAHCGGTNQCVSNNCQLCDTSDNAGCSGGTSRCLGGTSCVECTADAHCGGTRQCVSNSCQLCDTADNGGCGGSTPRCLGGTSCVQCTVDAHCGGTNQCVSNSCQLCDTSDNAGCSGGTPRCLGGTMCVQCTTDAQCGGTNQCVANTCRTCDPATGDGCSGGTPQCNASFMCVQCLGNGDCGGSTPQCVSSVCRLCNPGDDAGCGGSTPQCLSGTSCVECIGDSDCSGTPATPQCVANACEECDSADDAGCSAPTPQCKPASLMCVECLTNADCSAGSPTCNTSSNMCM